MPAALGGSRQMTSAPTGFVLNESKALENQPGPRHITRRLRVEKLADGRHLVFNPLSGAVDIAGEAELDRLERLRNGESLALTTAEEYQLRSRHYLFDSAADEEIYLEGLVHDAWARMQTAQPQVYTVCPTLACNLA